MDNLPAAFEKSTIDEGLIYPGRFHLYKNKGLSDGSKENRRLEFLEECKRKRSSLVNEKRGLINDEFNDDEDWMEWQEGDAKKNVKRLVNEHCKNQLMLSEWLLDVPHDLAYNWTCVLVPEGHRTLVIAKKGCTRAYNKAGMLMAKFTSILPNGSPLNRGKNCDIIILDCIWSKKLSLMFALDVLHWNNLSLLECDTALRLYWLRSRLEEVNNSCTKTKAMYNLHLPPYCSLAELSATLATNDPKVVDGILFYHNQSPYISGPTPLVSWLKPYMLPERLGIQVCQEYIDRKPATYVNLEQWVAEVSHAHTRKPKKDKRKTKNAASQNLMVIEEQN